MMTTPGFRHLAGAVSRPAPVIRQASPECRPSALRPRHVVETDPSREGGAVAGRSTLVAPAAVLGGLASARAARRRGGRGTARRGRAAKIARPAQGKESFRQILQLKHLGSSPADKALDVNLDPNFYGSFAEIGAGQEVSRMFLKAGAAAGTVARSISAYDMRMSDVNYGKAKRYVTYERLQQMLTGEYDQLEEYLRETKGPETRFFAFASTLAAKAYKSERECEGWVGITFQAEVGQPRSTVSLHVRMSDPTAQLQGEAIGILGTNLIYLCRTISDPYLIASFLLDGLTLGDEMEMGRLEVDFIEFSGPAFPEGSVDERLLALRMVQLRIAKAVVLQPDESGKGYKQAVPNNCFYKRPVVVERSRFQPVTHMHQEVLEACTRQLAAGAKAETKPPMQLFNLQVDDITCPVEQAASNQRISRMKAIAAADVNQDGSLCLEELKAMVRGRLSDQETEELFADLDVEKTGFVSIDCLFNISGHDVSFLASEFLDRFSMLEPLGFPVMLSSIRRTHNLATYISRYTKEEICIALGGGSFSISRALLTEDAGGDCEGGVLESLGRLCADQRKVFAYPNIDADGKVTPASVPDGVENHLFQYLVGRGAIVPVSEKFMSPDAQDPCLNLKYRFGSVDVRRLISEGKEDWAQYVPKEVAETVKTKKWFDRLSHGTVFADAVYRFLNDL